MRLLPGAVTHELEVNGATVRYHDSQADAAPIVLVHGTGGTTETHYGRVVPMLANRYRVIAVDLGVAPGTTRLELKDLVDQISAAVDHAELPGSFALAGYSLGAVAAAELASQRDDISHLVLLGGWLRTDAQQQLRNQIWRGLYESGSAEYGRSSVLNAYSPRFLLQRTKAELDALVASAVPDEQRALQMDLNTRVDLTPSAPRIAAETLIIAGEKDFIAPNHHAYDLLGAIQNARLAMLPTGHAIAVERPAQVCDLIDAFLSGRSQVAPGGVVEQELV